MSQPHEPDNPSFRDLYALQKEMRDMMDDQLKGCSNCKAELKEKITKLDGRVEVLEGKKTECKANRRSWRDYTVNGGFVVIAGVAVWFLDHLHFGS